VIAPALEFQERIATSRPSRLGTRRRRARQGHAALPARGASSNVPGHVAPSLDTEKQLATTVRDWSAEQETERERYSAQFRLHRQLTGTVHEIWQRWARAAREDESAFAEAAKWEKTWLRLNNCQAEWIGYKAACCGERSGTIAVPIGCNHRLCPLCAWNRSKKARIRIKSMFDRLTHPVMLTFTVPNQESIRKHDLTLFRQRVRKFIVQKKGWILGGVYSIETTYNRTAQTWHIHCHALIDANASLPSRSEKVMLAGQRVYKFTALKLRLEFDWLRLTQKGWGTFTRKDMSQARRDGDTYQFEEWVRLGREHKVKEYRDGAWRVMEGLDAAEVARRNEWNARNRRVIDVRPVSDRDGAAKEVLKYITKVADFGDIPEAVEQFCNAVKGARLIQTFGSWYGFNVETDFDTEHLDDWGKMECACGLNMWERCGVFSGRDVEMDSSGRWHLKRNLNLNCGGTVPRPTIRALDVHEDQGAIPEGTPMHVR
jgi:hypothetical protein